MRLFVAIDPAAQIREKLSEVISTLKPESRAPRWVRTEGMHLTLKFIGDVEAAKLDAIRPALHSASNAQAIALRFRGIGFFPSGERPRVAWCGIETGEELAALAQKVSDLLVPLGVAAETRTFAPHVTLARIPSGQQVDNLVRAANGLKSYDFGAMDAAEFHLFESFLKPSGAEYKRLDTFHFVKGSP
jgi:2'-5' RNA ligase